MTEPAQALERQFATPWSLLCPDCHMALERTTYECVCLQCGRHYKIEEGVIRFMDRDDFYEDRYEPSTLQFFPNERLPWGRALLYLVSMHYFWYIRQYLPSRGSVAGVEVSLA